MGYVYTILVVITIASLWYRSSRNLEAQGKGWFMRHWIASVMGCFVGFIQAMMLSSDAWQWNVLAVVISIGAVVLAVRPLPMPAK